MGTYGLDETGFGFVNIETNNFVAKFKPEGIIRGVIKTTRVQNNHYKDVSFWIRERSEANLAIIRKDWPDFSHHHWNLEINN